VIIALLAELAAVGARAGDKPQSLNLGIAPHATATLSMVILPQSVNVPGRCSSESKQC
jgi:hypothetical protein